MMLTRLFDQANQLKVPGQVCQTSGHAGGPANYPNYGFVVLGKEQKKESRGYSCKRSLCCINKRQGTHNLKDKKRTAYVNQQVEDIKEPTVQTRYQITTVERNIRQRAEKSRGGKVFVPHQAIQHRIVIAEKRLGQCVGINQKTTQEQCCQKNPLPFNQLVHVSSAVLKNLSRQEFAVFQMPAA